MVVFFRQSKKEAANATVVGVSENLHQTIDMFQGNVFTSSFYGMAVHTASTANTATRVLVAFPTIFSCLH